MLLFDHCFTKFSEESEDGAAPLEEV